MPDAPAPPPVPDPATLATLDLPAPYRAGVVENLRLLAEHWRRFAGRDA